jgi:TolB protein
MNGELRRVSDERFDYIWADFSPDASHILFYSHDEENNLDLFLMNADGNKLQQLADFSVADPAWSPDSKQIAYAYNGSISTMNVHEGTAVAIVSMYDTRAPAWSPDGEWIVFAGKSEENSYFQLYMVHSNGTELTLLTNTEQHHDLPVWQP